MTLSADVHQGDEIITEVKLCDGFINTSLKCQDFLLRLKVIIHDHWEEEHFQDKDVFPYPSTDIVLLSLMGRQNKY